MQISFSPSYPPSFIKAKRTSVPYSQLAPSYVFGILYHKSFYLSRVVEEFFPFVSSDNEDMKNIDITNVTAIAIKSEMGAAYKMLSTFG